MKVLYVITKASWGGAQKYVYELATAAKEAGHEVAVAYGEGGELAARLTAAGIPGIPLAGLARDVGMRRDSRALSALLTLFRRERPDVVHLNSSKAGALGALAARIAGIRRIVFTAHGWAWNESRPWWQKVVIWTLAWLTVLLAHQTICVSEAMRRGARAMPFVRRKLVVIYNGVDAADYLPRAQARAALWPRHEDGLWIGMLSELHPTKRIADAVEAMALLRKARPEAKLVVLGEGEERARLERLIAARELSDAVRLAGFVPAGDRYLKAFDLFLHASRSEALGLAVVEAGLAALPVVATKVGGIPEIVADGETGLLVPPERPEALAAALVALIEDPVRAARLGERLAEACRARFDRARMIHETFATYSPA
ncbi:MAG: glycosyltransferase [Patescibacteria group bacterium]|nr:glycosyltransferase [Patescibacteria group bacterium]MDE1944155.1 glycosyltransferase [Patescibacteria group bacterium]MDE1945438.1 glycosyltransferase [Patescibacteria group bacterium]MDE2057955.1 glycosyltransferase [Patescibacteria group bacterium]